MSETAMALAAFGRDPSGLVTACRRIVSRQPTSAPLWWLCSRMLCADDPMDEGRSASREIASDATPRRLEAHLPPDATITVVGWSPQLDDTLVRRGDVEALIVDAAGEGRAFAAHLWERDAAAVEIPLKGLASAVAESDLVVLDASAVGPSGFVAACGSHAAAAVARTEETPVWLLAGIGRILPQRVWECVTTRLTDEADPWELDEEVVPLELVDAVFGPDGQETTEAALQRTDCPIAPELFRPDIT